MNTTHKTKTKIDARAEAAIETAVTIDWSTISDADLKALAARTILIAAQAQWRKDGAIPAEATLNAHDFANPTRAPKKAPDLKALLSALSAEDRAALLASLA